MTPLSPHFTLEELTFSAEAVRHGLANTPNAEQVSNLTRLATTLLEPARLILGCPIFINSGFRTPEVNRLVGSTAPHSAHLDGCAADMRFGGGVDLRNAFDALRTNLKGYDQIIIEAGSWVHVSVPLLPAIARGEQLIGIGGPGRWSYMNA